MDMPDRFDKTKTPRIPRSSYAQLRAWAEDFKARNLPEENEDRYAFEDLCSVAILADEHRKNITDLSNEVRKLNFERTKSNTEIAFFRSIIQELIRKMDPYD